MLSRLSRKLQELDCPAALMEDTYILHSNEQSDGSHTLRLSFAKSLALWLTERFDKQLAARILTGVALDQTGDSSAESSQSHQILNIVFSTFGLLRADTVDFSVPDDLVHLLCRLADLAKLSTKSSSSSDPINTFKRLDTLVSIYMPVLSEKDFTCLSDSFSKLISHLDMASIDDPLTSLKPYQDDILRMKRELELIHTQMELWASTTNCNSHKDDTRKISISSHLGRLGKAMEEFNSWAIENIKPCSAHNFPKIPKGLDTSVSEFSSAVSFTAEISKSLHLLADIESRVASAFVNIETLDGLLIQGKSLHDIRTDVSQIIHALEIYDRRTL
ncbi:hypothetical protein BASA61_008405 [Batrachochytrium salamandrivorans]|nr:hypothetical protein BASA61_008405 [Batrachochytrium salamandrivorans]